MLPIHLTHYFISIILFKVIIIDKVLSIEPLKNGHKNSLYLDHFIQIDNREKSFSLELPKPFSAHYEEDFPSDRLSRSKTKIKDEFQGNKTSRSATSWHELRVAAQRGLDAMNDLYDRIEPNIFKKGYILDKDHPAAKLSLFNAPEDDSEIGAKAGYAALETTKQLMNSFKWNFQTLGRQAPPKISLRRTKLEGFCPPREPPRCPPASKRYRTHDGTCNNPRNPRWGSAQMPFHRFLAPEYSDGVDTMRRSVNGEPLLSPRFISLLVHGSKNEDAPVTLMLAQWGQFIDHDLTSTAQPRSINGSIPRCCGVPDRHPSCAPIKVPADDPWLIPVNVNCLEFLRSAPTQRPDCTLSWREQTNQVTSFLDASTIYSSNARTSDTARLFHSGLLQFGRGPPKEDVCHHGALSSQCIRPGDPRSGEQPGLLAIHHVMVGEHNRIATELAILNPHWSDEKIYQEARRIVGAMVQHITYREFLTLVLGRDVSRSFELELELNGYYPNYNPKINPGVANSFAASAFRFGHSLIQNTYMRSNQQHEFIDNNVTLHEENSKGDIGSPGSLHRLLRGLAIQRAQKRDEFITAELTNHLFQSQSFPFGLDLAAINIQRGRDHGLPPYTHWRQPCGLKPIQSWEDLEKVVGPNSIERIRLGYRNVDDVDLFVAGLAERPVAGGLVGPTFACIIAQQFSNLRKSDRFWYENGGFESSFTPAQLQSIRQVSLAQIVCRSLDGGTLQPHLFLPPELPRNERRPCGFGSLAPIDLIPWLEKDPFLSNNKPLTRIAEDDQIEIFQRPTAPPGHSVVNKVDFMSNGASGIQLPISAFQGSTTLKPLMLNGTFLSNKLDLVTNRPTSRPRPKPTTNDKLTTARPQSSIGTSTQRPTRTRPTKTKPTKKQRKRDIKTDDEVESRNRAKLTIYKKSNKTRTTSKLKLDELDTKKLIIIKTPDTDTFNIQINIQSTQTNNTQTTAKPMTNFDDFNNYDNYGPPTTPFNRPYTGFTTYYDQIKKTQSQSQYAYQQQHNPYTNTRPSNYMTIKPQFNPIDYDIPIIRPTYYGPNNDQPTKRPQFNPTNYNDNTSPNRPHYASDMNDYNQIPSDNYASDTQYRPQNSPPNRPYYTNNNRPQYDTSIRPPSPPYRPYADHPDHQRPTYSNDGVQITIQSNYDINNDIRPPRPTRPPQYDYETSTKYRPNKYSTPFSYDNYNNQHQHNQYAQHDSNFNPNPVYIDDFNGWDDVTTSRPDLYTYYGPLNDKPTSKPNSYLTALNQYRPSVVVNKFVDTFTDYFTSSTTTRRPFFDNNFEYSRQEDVFNIDIPVLRHAIASTNSTSNLTNNKASDLLDSPNNKTIDEGLTFDLDGYLRPEHMKLEKLADNNISISTSKNQTHAPDDYIIPTLIKLNNGQFDIDSIEARRQDSDILSDSIEIPKIENTDFNRENCDYLTNSSIIFDFGVTNSVQNPTDLTLAILRPITQSLMPDLGFETDAITQTETVIISTTDRIDEKPSELTDLNRMNDQEQEQFKGRANQEVSISIVPIVVLTKPERPDNWVHFDILKEKSPLPSLPQLEIASNSVNEMPKPMFSKTKYNDKLRSK